MRTLTVPKYALAGSIIGQGIFNDLPVVIALGIILALVLLGEDVLQFFDERDRKRRELRYRRPGKTP